MSASKTVLKTGERRRLYRQAKIGDAESMIHVLNQPVNTENNTVISSLSRDGIEKFPIKQVGPYRLLYRQIGALPPDRRR
jgi:hypothetical protein